MARAVYVTGEDDVRADLRGMARAARNLEPVLSRQARRTADGITRVQRRTGKLARDIKSPGNRAVTDSGFRIGVGTFYGHFVFSGTEHSVAEPAKIPGGVGRETARLIGDHIVQHRHGAL